MKYEDKFNRALNKATQQVRDWNGGAMREVSTEFSFSHDGDKHVFSLRVIRSNPKMECFGYGDKKNEDSLWKATSSHSHVKVELPSFIDSIILKEMTAKATQTEQEVDEIFNEFVQAFNNFKQEFCI